MAVRRTPYLVQLAWYVLEYHRHHRCPECADGDSCPAVRVARSRITAWRRFLP
ncbi:hypothetical protein O7606_20900 [Micromonospora sp. WMMD882]|uniref:hypothetical protein n=1 Tax=Micromonospora sp. WMMD882 TaxID=3015151 RepID=UPI00248A976D|nr:hypothetical protein [Micromonospora sp. WMMD882]WBB78647.1 hypothetical protein O7606_20900 [Micromonospora sp. WMMD882]